MTSLLVVAALALAWWAAFLLRTQDGRPTGEVGPAALPVVLLVIVVPATTSVVQLAQGLTKA